MKTKCSLVTLLALALTPPVAALTIAAQAGVGRDVPPPRPQGPGDIYRAAGTPIKKLFSPALFRVLVGLLCAILTPRVEAAPAATLEPTQPATFFRSARPYTRWWWFAPDITAQDIDDQLKWLSENHFGGVEIAWLYPPRPRVWTNLFNQLSPEEKQRKLRAPKWLSPEWSALVVHAKQQAGHIKSSTFASHYKRLHSLRNVRATLAEVAAGKPLVAGEDLPDYWARVDNDVLLIFFAHPMSRDLRLPLRFGQSFTDKDLARDVSITTAGRSLPLKLLFKPYQSLLVRISRDGPPEFMDILYEPPPAVPY